MAASASGQGLRGRRARVAPWARLDGAPSVVVGAEAAHGDGSGGVAEDDITMQLWLGVVGDGAAERCQGP